MQVNIHEAKTNFSRLLEQAARGEEVIIARAGKPLFRLVPLETAPKARKPGLSEGKIWMSEDFDAPLDDAILEEFES